MILVLGCSNCLGFNLSTFHLKDECVLSYILPVHLSLWKTRTIHNHLFQKTSKTEIQAWHPLQRLPKERWSKGSSCTVCDTLQKPPVTSSNDHRLSRWTELSTVQPQSPRHGSQGPSNCLTPKGKTPTDLQREP